MSVTLEALVYLVIALESGISLSKLRTDFDSLIPLSDATWDAKALQFDGKKNCLSFGANIEQCFADPRVCNNGVTIAFWLFRNKDDGAMSIFDTGKC